MVLINETSRIEAYAGPPARSRVATDPSEMSLRTHFQPDITIVEVGGVVDGCNAEPLSDYVADLASPGRPLILDLYCVNFFGSEGLRAFARIAEACQHKGLRWAVATSEAVDRLLHITDSTYRLPTTASLEALQQLTPHNRAWSLPHRVTPPEGTRCLKPIGRPTKTPQRRLDAPAAKPVCPPRVVTQPRTPVAQRAPRVEPRTVKGPVDARVITCYST